MLTACARIRGEQSLVGDPRQHRAGLDQAADKSHLGRTGQFQCLVPAAADAEAVTIALALPELEDPVRSIGVAVGAGEERPVGGLAGVVVVEVAGGHVPVDSVILIARLAVHARFG